MHREDYLTFALAIAAGQAGSAHVTEKTNPQHFAKRVFDLADACYAEMKVRAPLVSTDEDRIDPIERPSDPPPLTAA